MLCQHWYIALGALRSSGSRQSLEQGAHAAQTDERRESRVGSHVTTWPVHSALAPGRRTRLWRVAAIAAFSSITLHGCHRSAPPANSPPAAAPSQSPLTNEQQQQLNRAEELVSEAIVKYESGRFAVAAPLLSEAIEIKKRVLGDDYSGEGGDLNTLAAVYHKLGDNTRAETAYLKALDINKRDLGAEHPDYAVNLQNLATLYYRMGMYRSAEPLYSEAAEIRKKALGERHPSYASSLEDVGWVSANTGDYQRAEAVFKRLLAIKEDAVGKQHPEYARALNCLATLYMHSGDYARAEPIFTDALNIWKSADVEENLEYANCLTSLAELCWRISDFVRAEELLQRALKIKKQTVGEQHPDYAEAAFWLAEVYKSTGEYSRAGPLFLQAAETLKTTVGEQHPSYAAALNSIAALLWYSGDYRQALPVYRRALETSKKAYGEQHPAFATNLHNVAVFYQSIGDFARAEALHRQALEIRKSALGEEHADYAWSLNSLADLYNAMGDFARAEPLCIQALEIRKRVLGERHPDYAMSVNATAGMYRRMGDRLRAAEFYRRALDVWKSSLGERHDAYATCLSNLADVQFSSGDVAQAVSLYLQAIDILKSSLGENHPDYAKMLNGLGSLYMRRGEYAWAEPLLLQSMEIVGRHLEQTSDVQSENQQLALSQLLRRHLDGYLTCLTRLENRDQDASLAVLRWKGATLARQRAARLAAADPALAPTVSKLQQVTRQWAHFATAAVAPQQVEAVRKRVTELHDEKERLEAELGAGSAAFRESLAEVTIEAVARALPENAVIVDYIELTRLTPDAEQSRASHDERSLLAFVIRDDAQVLMFDLGPMATVEDAIDVWRASYGRSAQGQEAGRLLRERLWAPLTSALEGASLVLVSPDGALGKLPFGALPGTQPETFLLEENALAVIPAPRLLPQLVLPMRHKAEQALLLVGGIDYDHRAAQSHPDHESDDQLDFEAATNDSMLRDAIEGESWANLPGAKREVNVIRDMYARIQPGVSNSIIDLQGAEATEEAFSTYAPRCASLHVATHGFFAAPHRKSASSATTASAEGDVRGGLVGDRQRETARRYSPGLLSGLVFAGANQPPSLPEDPTTLSELPEDGILSAAEISQLSLDGVNLVVLSACETGLGESAGGEGLLGLQRAFHVAGANTTIASLWQVDDKYTQALMGAFYENLWEKKLSKLEALRQAQLEMLRGELQDSNGATLRGLVPDDQQPSELGGRLPPFYWAAFVLSGDWR